MTDLNLDKGDLVIIDRKGKVFDNYGVMISKNDLLICRGYSVKQINLFSFEGTKVAIVRIADPLTREGVVGYFYKSKDNFRLFRLGIKALIKIDNYHDFFLDPYRMLHFVEYKTFEEYEQAWNRVIGKMKKFDVFFSFDSRSLISRLIKSLDKGSWSHCGIYMGDGMVIEAVSKGVLKRGIESYKNIGIHLGVYRYRVTTDKEQQALDSLIADIGKPYGYVKAIILGIRTLCRLNIEPSRPGDSTPNGIIYNHINLKLVDYL